MKITPSRILTVIASVGVIALLLVCTASIIGGNTFAQGDPLTVETNPTAPSSNEGAQILALLTEMQNIKLDTAIFTDPLFSGLKDFTVDLAEEPKSRPNPFAPIGKDAAITFEMGSTTMYAEPAVTNTPTPTSPRVTAPIR